MAFQAHNFVLDDTLRLTSGITITAASTPSVGATTIDLGALAPGFNIDTTSINPYSRFAVVVDWTTLDVASGDETYYIDIQGSNSATFASGNYAVGRLVLGVGGSVGNAVNTPANSRDVFYFDNAVLSSASSGSSHSTMRYLRLRAEAFGTSPNIVITGAWLCPI